MSKGFQDIDEWFKETTQTTQNKEDVELYFDTEEEIEKDEEE